MSILLEVTPEDFDRSITSQNYCAVYISAPWCMPCRTYGPIVEAVAEDLRGVAVIFKFNGDGQRDFLAKYEVRTVPTVLIFSGDQVIGKLAGATTRSQLKSTIVDTIAKWKSMSTEEMETALMELETQRHNPTG